MPLKRLFESAVRELRIRNVPFAVAGGFAADLYRAQPRLTMDVDFVILSDEQAAKTATAVIEALGLHAGVVREADLAGGPRFAIRKRSTRPCMVVGRPEGKPDGEGVDILLPAVPWAGGAVRRAQANLVDYGFGSVPVLTVEDVVLSKLCSLSGAQIRAKDIDDLQSIFAASHRVDTAYLAGQMEHLGITIPRQALALLPDPLVRLGKDVARAKKATSR